MRAVSAIVVATLVALGSAATARANDVTFTFDSTVSRNLGFGVPLGTDYLFSYTIDTSEAPTSLATGSASYDVASATVKVDGQTLSATNGSLSIDYAPATLSSSGSGFYFVHFTEPDGSPLGTINGVNVLSLNLRFMSNSGTMLQNSGLSIPTTAAFANLATFDQADFDGAPYSYVVADNGVPFTFTASVPEPSSLLLLAIGVASAVIAARLRASRGIGINQ